MINKRGGIVALEPKTGEILALISAPTYDPALLVGRERSKNYTKLDQDSLGKPLYDRGLLAEYPPGSPFKIMTGLIGLQEEVIDVNSSFVCRHGFSYGRGAFMKCHDSGTNNLHTGFAHSCNTYFANVFKLTIDKYPKPTYGVDAWSNHLKVSDSEVLWAMICLPEEKATFPIQDITKDGIRTVDGEAQQLFQIQLDKEKFQLRRFNWPT